MTGQDCAILVVASWVYCMGVLECWRTRTRLYKRRGWRRLLPVLAALLWPFAAAWDAAWEFSGWFRVRRPYRTMRRG